MSTSTEPRRSSALVVAPWRRDTAGDGAHGRDDLAGGAAITASCALGASQGSSRLTTGAQGRPRAA
jgi:hypothetical protein